MLYLASLDTINFRFQALGATEQEALGILALAWEEHARQSGAYVTWDDLADDANVTALQLGHGYRDGSDIVEADTTGALEEHDATREGELSMARLEARKRIGAGE